MTNCDLSSPSSLQQLRIHSCFAFVIVLGSHPAVLRAYSNLWQGSGDPMQSQELNLGLLHRMQSSLRPRSMLSQAQNSSLSCHKETERGGTEYIAKDHWMGMGMGHRAWTPGLHCHLRGSSACSWVPASSGALSCSQYLSGPRF